MPPLAESKPCAAPAERELTRIEGRVRPGLNNKGV